MIAPGPGRTIIQRVVFPADSEITRLYLRAGLTDGSANTPPPEAMPRWMRHSALIPEGAALSLDTLFNHLPEAYWLEHTTVTGFVFTAVVRGVGEIHVLRRTKNGENILLAVQRFDTVSAQAGAALVEVTIGAPVDRAADAGALFLQIGARSGDVMLNEACWSAIGGEPQPVRLVAGYCTFKRDKQLLDNVEKVLGDVALRPHLARLVVVDQAGSDTLAAALRQLATGSEPGLLRLIRQGNFGGSGGFTRVMLEALAEDEATHVLLMDDDAKIETESIARAAAFLSLTKNLALGGQMLDLYRPTIIHETGAWFRPKTFSVKVNTPNLDAGASKALTTFAKVAHTDYNGWWFFAAPLAVIRAQGLPLPLFIHGDDIEYGLRLAQNGVETVTLPGVAIWHEPFYAKNRRWQSYYDFRNTLIMAGTPARLSGPRLARHFLSSLMALLLCYRYEASALTCRAVEDWLGGPDTVRHPPQDRHASLFAPTEYPVYRPIAVGLTVPVMPKLTTAQDVLDAVLPPRGWRLLRQGARAVLASLLGAERPPQAALLPSVPLINNNWWALSAYRDVALRPSTSAASFTGNTTCHRLHRSPRSFRRLLPRGLWLTLRLLLRGGAVARQWRRAAPGFHESRFWEAYLGPCERPDLTPAPAADRRVVNA